MSVLEVYTFNLVHFCSLLCIKIVTFPTTLKKNGQLCQKILWQYYQEDFKVHRSDLKFKYGAFEGIQIQICQHGKSQNSKLNALKGLKIQNSNFAALKSIENSMLRDQFTIFERRHQANPTNYYITFSNVGITQAYPTNYHITLFASFKIQYLLFISKPICMHCIYIVRIVSSLSKVLLQRSLRHYWFIVYRIGL